MKNQDLITRLQEIAEIYIGMEGFTPKTAPEAYLQDNLKEMYKEIEKLITILKS